MHTHTLQKKIIEALRNFFQKGKTKFAARKQNNNQNSMASLLSQSDNPYIAARCEWNYLFNDIIKAKYNWQRFALLSSMGNIFLIVGFIGIALQSKTVPYAVKIDNAGNAFFAGYLEKGISINPLEVDNFVRRYIVKVRSIIADPVAQKQDLHFIYEVSQGATLHFLNDYYRQNNPFEKAQETTTEVTINAALPKSDQTWQVNWTEIKRSLDGDVIGETHWEALITVAHHTESDDDMLILNPLGLFVEHLSWSQQR
jgi:type IV secretion system protein VirB5